MCASDHGVLGVRCVDERSVVRGMTVHAMRPTNTALLEWLRRDRFYKGQRTDKGKFATLAALLPQLEAHLLLWHAKYEIWIPDQQEHALVYLADEQKHGIGFPRGIDAEIAKLLSGGQSAPTD